jgi:hypothetical protein
MRKIFLALFVLAAYQLSAQFDCTPFYPFAEGAKMWYHNYNADGKLLSSTEKQVMSIRTIPNGATEAEISSIIKDENGKEDFAGQYAVNCKNGVLKMEVISSLTPMMLQSFQGMKMTLVGDLLSMPKQLKVGMELDDASTKISAAADGVNIINMDFYVDERKVEKQEKIITPAGEFDCYKITSKTRVDMMIKKYFTTIEYYAVEKGLVRTETLDQNGELISYTELVKLELP